MIQSIFRAMGTDFYKFQNCRFQHVWA